MGKGLWGHINGSALAPTMPPKLAHWQVEDAKVMTWMVNPLIVLSLRPHKTVKSM